MEIDEIRVFKIDRTSKPDCKLEVENDEIKIEKKEEKKDNYLFSMALRNARTFISCKPGEVKNLKVSPQAQNCGIGKMLTLLCFNEENIHKVENNENNLAVKAMKTYSALKFPAVDKVEAWITKTCKKFLYLLMTADPKSRGHLYFNTALISGYSEMFFALQKEKKFYPAEGGCSVASLKTRYTNDGVLTDDDGTPVVRMLNNQIKVWGENWFFCQPKTPTLPSKCPTEL